MLLGCASHSSHKISSELAAPHQFSKQVQATIAEVAHHGVITNSTDSKNVKWNKNGTGCV